MPKYKFSGTFKSSNQRNRIQYYIYEPECEARGIIQICHGMCEYLEMYEPFADFLCQYGFIVCGNDMLGHGNSITNAEDYGYFGESDGWKYILKDAKKLNQYMKELYPELPYILLGHSMGSFVARLYTACYGDSIDGAIYMGTSGPLVEAMFGKLFVKGLLQFCDGHHRSKLIHAMIFHAYNNRYSEENDSWSWLCHDEDFRKRYIENERNRFTFTLSGFSDLLSLLRRISVKKWYESIPKQMPYLLLSGREDPVGQYGRGVLKVSSQMAQYGCSDITVHLYEGDRHVLLREGDQEKVMDDILQWLFKHALQ